jgi:hypothetical protein
MLVPQYQRGRVVLGDSDDVYRTSYAEGSAGDMIMAMLYVLQGLLQLLQSDCIFFLGTHSDA